MRQEKCDFISLQSLLSVLGMKGELFELYGFLRKIDLSQKTGMDGARRRNYQDASSPGFLMGTRKRHGVTSVVRRRLRKVLVEKDRKGRTMDGTVRRVREDARERKREKEIRATRGSNLPRRRDFASEAGANC